MRLVVDVDRAAQSAAVVGGAAAPVEAHIVGQKHGDGAEVDLAQCGRIQLKTIPKHKSVACRGATKRSRRRASRAVGLDEHGTMLDEQIRQRGSAFRLQHEGIQLFRHQGFQGLDSLAFRRNLYAMQTDGVLSRKAK